MMKNIKDFKPKGKLALPNQVYPINDVPVQKYEQYIPNGITPEQFAIDYAFVGKIGEGSSCVVNSYAHKTLGHLIAVKTITLPQDPNIKKQIIIELSTLFSCKCKNIISGYGAFITHDSIKILMEHMNAGSLYDILQYTKRIPEQVLGMITSQFLQGLNYLHKELKVIHRDIKPSNILLNRNGEVKIADFGVSGKMESSIDGKTSWVGTVQYMSPERFNGGKYYYDTDIWSLGLTLYECAMGSFPFMANDSFLELMALINKSGSPTLSEEFSPDFRQFVAICLNKKPGNRSTAGGLLKHPFMKKYLEVNSVAYLKDWIMLLYQSIGKK